MTLGLACLLLLVVPGPTVLFVVGRALSYGRGVALAGVLGNSVGCYAVAVAAALGLGPLIARSDAAFAVLKLAGAAYLVFLGLRALRHASAPAPAHDPSPRRRLWPAMRSGVVVGFTNPKALVLFMAVVPQFVNRAAGDVTAQLLILAVIPIVLGAMTDTMWALAAGQARAWLSGTPRRMRTLGRIGGLSMIGLGVSVAATGRHH
jgi:threonine/homoserine/homoserine lactone efflux protein